MQCPQCHVENRDTAKFCEECGSKLARACPGCSQEVSPRAKFCPECGMRLTESTPSPNSRQAEHQQAQGADPTASLGLASAQRSAPEAERRQLTVLFCDLVDSTALAGQLDPEAWRNVVRAYQSTCAEVIRRFEGYIAQYLGDGLLIYFGYPQAHEDDAQRAVRTGLGMVDAMGKLNAQLQADAGIQLAVRVGIHTGLVVVGEMGGDGRQEPLALGDTPNIAARLQGLAEPDTVVISAATHRLVQGYFACHDRGFHALKGVTAPLTVYRVLGDSGVQSRLEVASPRGLTPFVGRESELTLLLERWGQVREGRGQAVVLVGEAGIGKSRLLETFTTRLGDDAYTRLTFRGSPYAQQSALYPVIEHLQRSLPWPSTDAPEAKIDTLVQLVQAYGWPMAQAVPLLAALLAVPVPDGRFPPLGWTPPHEGARAARDAPGYR
jgi:class 3 adenylate cyclase